MVEIPEHLLNRTKARKQALGLAGADDAPTQSGAGGGTATAVAAPPAGNSPAPGQQIAKTQSINPKYVGPPQAPPLKHRVPFYVMPVFIFLPIWALLYFGSLRTQTVEKKAEAIPVIPGAVVIKAQNTQFDKTTYEAKAGDTIQFQNLDPQTPHTVTAKDGTFDTGSVTGPSAKTITVTKKGKFAFFCTFHSNMQATLTVK